MIFEKLYRYGLPKLRGKRIAEIVIGLSLISITLDDGSIGVVKVLRNTACDICKNHMKIKELIGRSADEFVLNTREAKNVIAQSLCLAILSAISSLSDLNPDYYIEGGKATDAITVRSSDKIGVIGPMNHIVTELSGKVDEIFQCEQSDEQLESKYTGNSIYEELKKCQVIFAATETILFNSFKQTLKIGKSAREFALIGPATPLFPAAYSNTGVSLISGIYWMPEYKELIMESVRLGAGLGRILPYGKKIIAFIS